MRTNRAGQTQQRKISGSYVTRGRAAVDVAGWREGDFNLKQAARKPREEGDLNQRSPLSPRPPHPNLGNQRQRTREMEVKEGLKPGDLVQITLKKELFPSVEESDFPLLL